MNDLNETNVSGRLGIDFTGLLSPYTYRCVTAEGCSRDFEEMIELACGNLPPQGLEMV